MPHCSHLLAVKSLCLPCKLWATRATCLRPKQGGFCCSCLEVQHFTIVKCGSCSKICLVALWSNSVELLPPTRWWSFDGGKLSSFFAYRVSGFPHFPPGQKQKLAECNVWVHVCILSFLYLQTACPLLCNLSSDTEETVKWIRWSDCYLFLLLFLVYCFSYSAESLIDCLCSCTLANLRLVSQSGFKMASPIVSLCTHADQGQLPTSVPHPIKKEKPTPILHSHSDAYAD